MSHWFDPSSAHDPKPLLHGGFCAFLGVARAATEVDPTRTGHIRSVLSRFMMDIVAPVGA
jgi:hypothetical protein